MAALAAQLKESSAMTPVEREAKKSRREKAEDIAYTINHAISCGITDVFIQSPISAYVSRMAHQSASFGKFFRFLENLFEKHEHHTAPIAPTSATSAESIAPPTPPTQAPSTASSSKKTGFFSSLTDGAVPDSAGRYSHIHGPGCGHDIATPPAPASDTVAPPAVSKKPSFWSAWSGFRHELGHWFVGEAAGDFGAVPLTIAVQRFFPGFMHGVRKVIEPVAGIIYRKGAERSARQWAIKEGFDAHGPEAQTKAAEIYEHEVSHLPQALVWNVFSIPINLMVQKYALTSTYTMPELLVGKTFGSLVSNGVLLGGRAVAPQTFGKWDDFNTRNLIMPVSKAVGSVFGVDNDTMDRVGREHEHNGRPGSKISGTRYDTRLQEHPAALAAQAQG